MTSATVRRLAVALLFTPGSPAFGQLPVGPDKASPAFHDRFDGDAIGARLGWAVSTAGDVDADGFADIIVGAPLAEVGADRGIARIYSGQDGSVIRTLTGAPGTYGFGNAVAAVGDVDKDGTDDQAVGAHNEPNSDGLIGAGAVYVFSGETGALLYRWEGDDERDQFGMSVGGAGDVDGDNYPDVLMGAPSVSTSPPTLREGYIQVRSGRTGAVLTVRRGAQFFDQFGFSVAGIGDVDLDNHDDYVVGARDALNLQGYAQTFSGKTGSLLHTLTFAGPGIGASHTGHAVSGIDDINADGRPDVVVGSNGDVAVFSGADGSIVRVFQGEEGDGFGLAVGSPGDINDDGAPELLIGAPGAGFVDVLSGTDWSRLARVTVGAPLENRFAHAVAGAGDVNKDGYPDIVVGAYRADHNGSNSGSAYVFTRMCPESVAYCTAKTSPLGCIPSISSLGTPSASKSDGFVVYGSGVRNNTNGMLFFGTSGRALFPFEGGVFCLQPPVSRTEFSSSGGTPAPVKDCTGIFAIDMNRFGFQSGGAEFQQPFQRFNVQWWARDVTDPFGSQLSDALEYQLCP